MLQVLYINITTLSLLTENLKSIKSTRGVWEFSMPEFLCLWWGKKCYPLQEGAVKIHSALTHTQLTKGTRYNHLCSNGLVSTTKETRPSLSQDTQRGHLESEYRFYEDEGEGDYRESGLKKACWALRRRVWLTFPGSGQYPGERAKVVLP